ncbi:hypothetical protein [Paenibacillus marinisediminis]
MTILLIAMTILLFAAQTLSMKLIRADNLRQRLLINTGFTLIASSGLLLYSLFQPKVLLISSDTLLLGIMFGLVFTLTIIFYNLAISIGPLSYTAFYFSASMIIPALTGIIAFDEPLKVTVIAAIMLFLAAFYFINVNPDTRSGNKTSQKWKIYCLLTFLCNGSLAVIQKVHQYKMEGTQSDGLMLVGFCSAFVFYAIAYGVMCMVRNAKMSMSLVGEVTLLRNNILPMVLLAATSLIGNLIMTYLSGFVPSSYLFPLVQGSILVSITLCSVLIFREHLSRVGRIGLTLGLAAIVIINF